MIAVSCIVMMRPWAGSRWAAEPPTNNHPSILFLGDSFVWGYDVDAEERFTDKLQAAHPEWNVYNCGVSGYGTDQEFLLFQLHAEAYKPKVVFLMFSTETDEEDNTSNARYGGYYKPYCTVRDNALRFEGIPVPRSERAFWPEHPTLSQSYLARLCVRAWFKATAPRVLRLPSPTAAILRTMQKQVASSGAVLVMGLTQTNPGLEDFLRHYQIPYVDVSTPLRYPGYGNHWTPEGNTFVCRKIEEFLRAGKFMDAAAPPSAGTAP